MDTFFNPRRVAVIGASNSPFNLGSTICRALNEYSPWEGDVFAVNRKGEDVCGCRGYQAVTDIEADVDLAVIITPAKVVPEFVEQCAAKGIKRIIIESSGFSEGGEEGRAMQRRIDETAKAHGIRIMGPNCLGVLNTRNGFCCFYGMQPDNHHDFLGDDGTGSVSFIIQSGGIVVIVLESFTMDVVKANKIVSIGNKSDIDEADVLEYFEGDDSTRVIAMYLENIKQGKKFIDVARKVKKPVLVFKVGRTSEGARAAMSHTAGMANNDAVFDTACRQAGVIRVNSISELHSLPKMFTHMPPLKGRRIAVFTNSGAFGGITADLLVQSGLEMARLSKDTQEKLARTGQIFNASNPVDLGPAISMQTFLEIFDILLSSDEVDGLLPVPSLWHPMVIDAIVELVKKCHQYGKPAAIYTPNAVHKTVSYRNKYQVPLFESPEEAVRALRVSYQHSLNLAMKQGFRDLSLLSAEGGKNCGGIR
ncbi:MAG TPA: CoA-binding protein [Deltaproteobacteria bacterium]|jgi:acyl-CoA synthetase (NDP forming)|nr:CoA-binding protein [Deltaproteobacteria bacterium]HOI06710.1 CoA-binding protein [Deltaproteobacteria bacterium]